MNDSRINKELQRGIRNFKYEQTETGIFFPEAQIAVGGVFSVTLNGQVVDEFHNLVVSQGLSHIVSVILGSASKIGTWYVAPFAGNATPANGWTAANFNSNATEFTNYTELTRRTFTPGSESGGAINNLSARAEFTIGSGVQDEIYGAGLISASAKEATTGVLLSAGRLPSPRQNLQEGDVLGIGYSFTATDAS